MQEKIKLFAMSNQMAERALDLIEANFNLDLGHDAREDTDKDDEYYPQLDEAIRKEAAQMGQHYEVFYCLENSIRLLIKKKLESELGANWWEQADIPDSVRKNVEDNLTREVDEGLTPRSNDQIDYTNFGELGEIVRKNWAHFEDMFSSQKACRES